MTQKEKIIDLLSDGEWHNATELHDICWRFGARIFDLKHDGYEFEKRKGQNGLEDWRLLITPEMRLPELTPKEEPRQQQDRLFAISSVGRGDL